MSYTHQTHSEISENSSTATSHGLGDLTVRAVEQIKWDEGTNKKAGMSGVKKMVRQKATN